MPSADRLGIDELVEPKRGGAGDADHHGLSRCRGEAMFRRFSKDRGIEPVGDDEAGILRKDRGRHTGAGCKVKLVSKRFVEWPFEIGAEILDRGFHLDDNNGAIGTKRSDIRPMSGGKREFLDAGIAKSPQVPLDAPEHKPCFIRS